jgi:hypothetical protein
MDVRFEPGQLLSQEGFHEKPKPPFVDGEGRGFPRAKRPRLEFDLHQPPRNEVLAESVREGTVATDEVLGLSATEGSLGHGTGGRWQILASDDHRISRERFDGSPELFDRLTRGRMVLGCQCSLYLLAKHERAGEVFD